VVYLRALDGFAAKSDRKTLEEAKVRDARRYLTRLKQKGPSKTAYGNASAALKFFFREVRGLEWRPMSPLRKRMIEDMQLAGFEERTQSSYVRSVEGLARYYMRSPDQLSEEELRAYFVHLTCERKLARPTVTIALCGIKFLYERTLKRDWSLTGVPVPKRKKTVPVVLSKREVVAILSRITEVRHRACLFLIYACGLRLSEGCQIQVTDIDRERGLLHVRGKGAKERYVPLPAGMIPLLAACWYSHQNPVWIFPSVGRGSHQGPTSDRHVPLSTIQQAFRKAYKVSGVTKKVSVHSLRHAYATHLLEARVPLHQIQAWLGHSGESTTRIYTHLTEQSTQASASIVSDLMSDIGDMA
jgi:site-specific recombinase XerD